MDWSAIINFIKTLNLLDYFILSILILSGFLGLRRGFMMAAGKITSYAVAIGTAYYYYDELALYLEEYYGMTTALAGIIRDKTPLEAISMQHQVIQSGFSYVDTAQYLAYLSIALICFLVIMIVCSQLMQLAWNWLESLFSVGMLAGINHVLGVVLALLQTIAILTVIIGLAYPAVALASRMGFYSALFTLDYMNTSVAVNWMLNLFGIFQSMLGIHV